MFSNKYGLETAVLNGEKTMMRKQFYIPEKLQYLYLPDDKIKIVQTQRDGYIIRWCDSNENARMTFYPEYKIGEVVAIAQSYKDIGYDPCDTFGDCKSIDSHLGWNNKMFVKASLMPHHIRFTDIKAERLQDISDEDCLKEGIVYYGLEYDDYGDPQYGYEGSPMFINAIDAFSSLIDKVSGKETWKMNPYVFAYSFERVINV